jgi:hypothetical protein
VHSVHKIILPYANGGYGGILNVCPPIILSRLQIRL